MRVFIDFPLRHASLSNGIASPQFTKNQQEVEKRSGSKIGQNLTCMFFFGGGGGMWEEAGVLGENPRKQMDDFYQSEFYI